MTAARGSPPAGLSRIEKPRSPSSSSRSAVTRSTVASGGASAGSRARKRSTVSLGRLDLDDHAARVVQHVPGHPQLVRQPVHVGPEAHALDGALDRAPGRGSRPLPHPTSSRSTWYALACASWMRGMCSERVTTTWSASPSAATRPPS